MCVKLWVAAGRCKIGVIRTIEILASKQCAVSGEKCAHQPGAQLGKIQRTNLDAGLIRKVSSYACSVTTRVKVPVEYMQ